jgi:hypothetical protein
MTEKPREPVDLTDTSHPLYDPARDPTHPLYEGNKTEAEQRPEPSDEDTYKVGPGFPPNEHKWKKGIPSPYPKGRPKKVHSLKPDVKKLFEDALNEKIEVTISNKKTVLTKLELGLRQLATQFGKGDRYARRDVFTYAVLLGVDLKAKEILGEALGTTHQAIVDAFLRRQTLPSTPTPTPEVRVKAPPDLVDDDVATPKPDKPGAAPPKPAPLPKKPQLGLDQYGNQKPRDTAFIQTEREWNIAKNKRDSES